MMIVIGCGCAAARQAATLPFPTASGSSASDSSVPPALERPKLQQASGQVAANLVAEIQAELAALRQDVGEQVNALISRADHSVNNYDAWTLRINALCQAAGAWLPWIVVGLPLVTYVVPKLAWKGASTASRRMLNNSTAKQ